MSSLKLANYVGVSTLLLLLGSTAQAQAATPPVGQPLFGEWDRLNSIGSPPAASEHEVMHFGVEGKHLGRSLRQTPRARSRICEPAGGEVRSLHRCGRDELRLSTR